MLSSINFKRIFITTIIASLVISALIGIFIFLFGSFDQTQFQILFTTLAIGGASIAGLANITLYNKNKYQLFAVLGIAITTIAFLSLLFFIWGNMLFDTETLVKWTLVFIILAASFAHMSLLLLITPRIKYMEYVLLTTCGCISAVALIIVYLILEQDHTYDDFLFRLLGTFAILDILGTILTPILNKVITPKQVINPPLEEASIPV